MTGGPSARRGSAAVAVPTGAPLSVARAERTDGPLVAELRRDGLVSSEEVRRAAAAYLADPGGGPFRLGNGHMLDVAAAVERHGPTAKALSDLRTPPVHRQLLVLNALSLARTAPP